jgi:hypothetical protein
MSYHAFARPSMYRVPLGMGGGSSIVGYFGRMSRRVGCRELGRNSNPDPIS